MMPLPVEQTGESPAAGHGGSVAGGGDLQRLIPTPFLTKTYNLVDDPSVDDMISWNDDGSTFIVWRPAEFARDLLPKYFKHNNFSSFVRQLNTYGFRKVVPDRWEFANDGFKRGEKELLRDIQRRKISAAAGGVTVASVPAVACVASPSNSGEEQLVSSNSSPVAAVPTVAVAAAPIARTRSFTTTPEVIEENERLRNENAQLSHELTQLKGLCNNILALMTNYSSGPINSPNGSNNNANSSNKVLELLALTRAGSHPAVTPPSSSTVAVEEEINPRLFGVSIGTKRMRIDDEDERQESSNDQQDSQENELGSDVKSETLDVKTSRKDHRDRTWLELGK
ncbi:heat stress transcription factor B-2b [Mercurialis annua]|uniref:heat stress transcription factor B-2b n=1 Tax=Mercurialis annua TaxID=3986 RepID=UPI00215E8F72|nr:heat stress transcription factor B-2b [Mercurialis annua]